MKYRYTTFTGDELDDLDPEDLVSKLSDRLGKSGYGRTDTREQATGIETIGAPKAYEFGDTLNLDAAATLLNAEQREIREAREASVARHKSAAASQVSVPESTSPLVPG